MVTLVNNDALRSFPKFLDDIPGLVRVSGGSSLIDTLPLQLQPFSGVSGNVLMSKCKWVFFFFSPQIHSP